MSFNDGGLGFVKGNNDRIHFCYMSKDEAINKINNATLSEKMCIIVRYKVLSFFLTKKLNNNNTYYKREKELQEKAQSCYHKEGKNTQKNRIQKETMKKSIQKYIRRR